MHVCHSKHKLSYAKSVHHSKYLLKLIHSDVWGPSLVESHLGYHYYVTFVDDYSRYT